MAINKDDVLIKYIKTNRYDERWSLNEGNGVQLTHIMTGKIAESTVHSSREENMKSAMYALEQKANGAQPAPSPVSAVPDFDVQQVKRDFENGVLLGKATIAKLIEVACEKASPVQAPVSTPQSIKVWQDRTWNQAIETAAKTVKDRAVSDEIFVGTAVDEILSLKRK